MVLVRPVAVVPEIIVEKRKFYVVAIINCKILISERSFPQPIGGAVVAPLAVRLWPHGERHRQSGRVVP